MAEPGEIQGSISTNLQNIRTMNHDTEIERLREESNNWHQHYRDERSTAQRWQEHCFKQVQEIERLHNVIRDEWPPDQAEEIIKNCKK